MIINESRRKRNISYKKENSWTDRLLIIFVLMPLIIPGRLPRVGRFYSINVGLVMLFFLGGGVKFSRWLMVLYCVPFFTTIFSFLHEMITFGWSTLLEIKAALVYSSYRVFFHWIFSASQINKEKLFRLVISFFAIGGVFLACISIQQTYNTFGLNAIYMDKIIPADSPQMEAFRISERPRPLGLIGNPNELGFQLGICLIASFFAMLHFNSKKYYFTTFLLSFLGLILTSSRSSYVFALAGVSCVLIGSKINLKSKFYIISLTFITFALVLTFGSDINILAAHINRVLSLLDISSDRSWQLRSTLYWGVNIEWFAKSPVWGVPSLPDYIDLVASDNEWLLLLRKWGFVGTGAILLSLLLPFLVAWYQKKAPRENLYLALGLLVGGGLYMIPAAFISSISLYTLWAVLYFSALM